MKRLGWIGLAGGIAAGFWWWHNQGGAGAVDYHRDVAPILDRHCLECHRPGQSGPFRLDDYEHARKRARQIVDVIESGFMPPWKPEPGFGDFAGARVLSAEEKRVLRRWANLDAPEGSAEGRVATARTDGWQLGEPDLVVSAVEVFELPEEGRDVYRNFVIGVPIDEMKFVRTVEFRPENPRVIHHMLLEVDRRGSARQLDAQDDVPGFGGGMAMGGAEVPDGHFMGWAPGQAAFAGYEDMAWRLKPGDDLVLQIHMRPSGKIERVQPKIGLFFADRPPTRTPYALVLRQKRIDIPAGEPAYVVEQSFELPVAVQVLSVYPHAHYLGKELKATALLPGGEIEPLIWIRDWDFNWQDAYRYREPVFLPAGTVIGMRYVFDNSSENIRNPHQPPQRVVYGPNSTDEMAELLLQVVPAGRAELARLQRAAVEQALREDISLNEERLRSRPGDPKILNDLGLRYRQIAEPGAAKRYFESALRSGEAVAMESALARSQLGELAIDAGDLEQAVAHFEAAVALRDSLGVPQNAAIARHQLADALGRQRKFAEAIGHLRDAIKLMPEDVGLLLTLARILVAPENTPEADRREALSLAIAAAEKTDHRDPVVLETLARAHAAAGDRQAAADALDRAIQLAVEMRDAQLEGELRKRRLAVDPVAGP